jgi:hypothetical protein
MQTDMRAADALPFEAVYATGCSMHALLLVHCGAELHRPAGIKANACVGSAVL